MRKLSNTAIFITNVIGSILIVSMLIITVKLAFFVVKGEPVGIKIGDCLIINESKHPVKVIKVGDKSFLAEDLLIGEYFIVSKRSFEIQNPTSNVVDCFGY